MINNNAENILVITTGGTIGSLPVKNPQKAPQISDMPPDGRDIVWEFISEKFALLKTRCVSLEQRDSQLIDELYRNHLAEIIETAQEDRVLVTHGTVTLLQTADFLYHRFKANPSSVKKLVILTGAMVPLANGEQSEAYLNLAFSLNQLSQRNPDITGIYFVLCDFASTETETGEWRPRLYAYKPNTYEKTINVSDNRFSRIKRL